MKDFFHYFFGKGETEEFRTFSLAHLIPILVMIGIILLIYFYRDKIRECKNEHVFRWVLAFMMIVSEMSYFWRLAVMPELGGNAVDHLPITVCGWATIFCSYMIVTKSQSLFDIAYFWLFSATIFALITPTVITFTGPTRYRFYQFWMEHTLGPGANYLYMARPEDTPSILDILPPNYALRIFVMFLAVSTLFFLAYLPWLLIDKKAKARAKTV